MGRSRQTVHEKSRRKGTHFVGKSYMVVSDTVTWFLCLKKIDNVINCQNFLENMTLNIPQAHQETQRKLTLVCLIEGRYSQEGSADCIGTRGSFYLVQDNSSRETEPRGYCIISRRHEISCAGRRGYVVALRQTILLF